MKVSALCICLNESEMIQQMLQYLVGVVDEIVIVDGGSIDGTNGIIENFAVHSPVPIKLFHREMGGDFSAQRNFAIEQCSGDWILSIDADEKYTNSLKRVMPELLNNNQYLAYSFPTFHLIDDDKHHSNKDTDPHVRLFRNIPEIRYDRPIHEVLKYQDQYLTPHPSHMNEKVKSVVSYRENIRLLHYGPLKSDKSLLKKQNIWNSSGHTDLSGNNGIPINNEHFINTKKRLEEAERYEINYSEFD